MARIPDRQIAGAAQAAGFRGRALTIAVAVALAESGGDPTAKNTSNSNGSTDFGLWQINSIHATLLRSGSWSNPTDNARMAYAVYREAGNSFSPWVAYKNGRYLAFVGRANAASGSPLPPQSAGTTAVPSGLPTQNPFAGLINLAELIANPATWIRAGMFLGGGVLLIWGILSLIKLDNTLARGAVKLAVTKKVVGK